MTGSKNEVFADPPTKGRSGAEKVREWASIVRELYDSREIRSQKAWMSKECCGHYGAFLRGLLYTYSPTTPTVRDAIAAWKEVINETT
jgi:hypothetical protein